MFAGDVRRRLYISWKARHLVQISVVAGGNDLLPLVLDPGYLDEVEVQILLVLVHVHLLFQVGGVWLPTRRATRGTQSANPSYRLPLRNDVMTAAHVSLEGL